MEPIVGIHASIRNFTSNTNRCINVMHVRKHNFVAKWIIPGLISGFEFTVEVRVHVSRCFLSCSF